MVETRTLLDKKRQVVPHLHGLHQTVMAVLQASNLSSPMTCFSLAVMVMTLYLLRALYMKVLEAPSNTSQHKTPFLTRKSTAGKKTDNISHNCAQSERLRLYKDLYFKLQNLEDFPEILPQAYALLQALLGNSFLVETSLPSPKSILSVSSYSSGALRTFILEAHNSVLDEYEKYVLRRESGGGPELFTSRKGAEGWLLKHAPVKCVDGSWLGRIHSVNTPFAFRGVLTKAFQILSEELGDGDIEKNHVRVYRELLASAGFHLPAGDTLEFTQDGLGMDELQPWKAAVGQLLISLFPSDFLPEALGFNLQFEMLTFDTLQSTRELPTYGLSALYHLLHVSIDNADSGHTAMALDIVIQYLDIVQQTEGCDAMQKAWRRVQAGYVLSERLAQESSSDGVWPSELEARLARIFKGKALVSDKLHCRSRAKIGNKTLTDWLSPNGWIEKQDQQSKLRDLAGAIPWIVRGHPEKSLLLRELSWKGKMYGAFTTAEIDVLRQWVVSLDSTQPEYEDLVGPIRKKDLCRHQNLLKQSLTNIRGLPRVSTTSVIFKPRPPIKTTKVSLAVVLSLWFVHPCVLENALSAPHTSSKKLSALVLLLTKAEQGLAPGPGSSLFELGMQIVRRHSFQAPSCLEDILEENTIDLANCLLSWSMRPGRHIGFLLGLARAFIDFEAWVANEGLLDGSGRAALLLLVARKQEIFSELLGELGTTALAEFISGYKCGRLDIEYGLLDHSQK